MVEVRVIAEGVSGLPKYSKKKPIQVSDKDSERLRASPTYHAVASKTASRMQAENKLENKRVRPRDIKRMIMRQLQAGDPTASKEVLEKLVDQLLPSAMERYKGPDALVHAPSDEVRKIKAERERERRRIVRANRENRIATAPPARSDKKWMART